MDRLLLDLRHSLRALWRTRGLALGAVLALALGIGATTTLFSIVHGGTRTLPFDEAHELVVLTQTNVRAGQTDLQARPFDYAAWSEQQTSFEALAAFSTSAVNIADPDMRPERRSGVRIAPAAFDLIGVAPIRGRGLTARDAAADAPAVALIAHDLWQARYAGDPDIAGRIIRIDGRPHVIVGVMPPEFGFPVNEEIWLPLRLDPSPEPATGESLRVFGRLRDGVTLEQARAEMGGIAGRLARVHPGSHAELGVRVIPFVDMEMDPAMVPVLYLMLLAVSFVLVIACVNVANLLLARAATRTKEVAIRTALGASRRRIVAQHLLESLVLALAGGAVGVLIAFTGVRFFDVATANIIEAFWIDFRVDRIVLAFATSLVGIAGVAAGILPALRASGAPGSAVLKEGAGAGNLRIGRLSRGLVVAELALMCGLLAVSGTFVKAAIGLRAVDLPFDARQILTAQLSFTDARMNDDARRARTARELADRVLAIPGVTGAALVSTLPGRGANQNSFTLEPGTETDARHTTGIVAVTPGFLDVLGARVLRGRNLSWSDDGRTARVALVNESWVRRYSADQDPIGRTIIFTQARPTTIVGIVPDLQMQDPDETLGDGVYVPILQQAPYTVRLMARGSTAPLALAPAVLDHVQEIDPDLPVFEIATLHDAIYSESRVLDAFGVLFAAFGAGALILAVIGLYGVVSFGVAQRRREFGVRIACGARRIDILTLVARQGATSITIGAILGLLLAIALQSGLASVVDFVEPGDVVLFAGVFTVLVFTAGVALVVPARRAAATEPLTALRHE